MALIYVLSPIVVGVIGLDIAMTKLPDLGPVPLALLGTHLVPFAVMISCLIIAVVAVTAKDRKA
jgi:hypothetical protein